MSALSVSDPLHPTPSFGNETANAPRVPLQDLLFCPLNPRGDSPAGHLGVAESERIAQGSGWEFSAAEIVLHAVPEVLVDRDD